MEAVGEVLSSSITGFIAEAWRKDPDSGTADDGEPGSKSGDRLSRAGKLQSSERISPESVGKPSFGSFLKAWSEDRRIDVIGVVYNIVTGPLDQHHKPMALRMSRSELQREQPQIFSLLKTEWHVATVAYKEAGLYKSALPPFPPEVHDFVYRLDESELLEVSEDLEFLRMLSAVPGVPADELMSAVIKNAARSRQDNYGYLVEAGRHLSKLLRDDYDRLAAVLRKIKP